MVEDVTTYATLKGANCWSVFWVYVTKTVVEKRAYKILICMWWFGNVCQLNWQPLWKIGDALIDVGWPCLTSWLCKPRILWCSWYLFFLTIHLSSWSFTCMWFYWGLGVKCSVAALWSDYLANATSHSVVVLRSFSWIFV